MRDEKFEIVPEHTVEVRIDSALLEVLDGPRLMRVHPHHGLRNFQRLVSAAQSILDIEPFFKPFDEGLLGDRFGLLTADAAAEQIVEAAACPEEAARLGV